MQCGLRQTSHSPWLPALSGGYTAAMTIPMQDLIDDLETRINTMVEWACGAELDLYYAEVLDFEQALDKLYDAIYFVGDQVATEAVASR